MEPVPSQLSYENDPSLVRGDDFVGTIRAAEALVGTMISTAQRTEAELRQHRLGVDPGSDEYRRDGEAINRVKGLTDLMHAHQEVLSVACDLHEYMASDEAEQLFMQSTETLLGKRFESLKSSRISHCDRQMSKIFPVDVASVNVDDIGVEAPMSVRRLQRNYRLTPELADDVYIESANQARSYLEAHWQTVGVELGLRDVVTDGLEVYEDDISDYLHEAIESDGRAMGELIAVAGTLLSPESQAGNAVLVQRMAEYFCGPKERAIERWAMHVVGQLESRLEVDTNQLVDAHFRVAVGRALDIFKQGLVERAERAMDQVPDPISIRNQEPPKGMDSAVNELAVETSNRRSFDVPDDIVLSKEVAPWLDDGEAPVIASLEGGQRNVIVVDARTEEARKFEPDDVGGQKLEKKGDISPEVQGYIDRAAELVADNARGDLQGYPTLKKSNSNDRFPYAVRYKKNKGPDAIRAYFSSARVDTMKNGKTQQQLLKSGVDRIIFYLGACKKADQSGFLKLFTTRV